MKKYREGLLFILIIVQFAVIVFLFYKIRCLYDSKVKGVQYVTDLREHVEVVKDIPDFSFFYEPKAGRIDVWDPDWLGKRIENRINSDTLNDRFDYSPFKKEKTFRIVTLGNSHTYGLYVDTKDNYPEVLEDLLNNHLSCKDINNFEVINLGVKGYDIKYSAERLKRRGLKYDPDLIIFLLLNLDFTKMDDIHYFFAHEFQKQGFDDVESFHKAVEAVGNRFSEKEILDYEKSALYEINNIYGDKILIMSFPSLNKKYQLIINEFISSDPAKKSYFNRIIDIPNNKTYQLPDSHPNTEGYKRLASDIFDYLLKNYLPLCELSKDRL